MNKDLLAVLLFLLVIPLVSAGFWDYKEKIKKIEVLFND
jgi:hypothetical protein